MNGIHCRMGDLIKSGKYVQYTVIFAQYTNLSTDISSWRLLIHTNGGLSKWIVKRTFANECKKSCGISSSDMPQLFSSYANSLLYFSFISVFHHFYFLSFLPAIVLRHQSFLLLHNHHIIDHNISLRSYPRGLVSKAGCQITESRNRKQ